MDAELKTYHLAQGDFNPVHRSTGSDSSRSAPQRHANLSWQKRWLLQGLPETLALLLAAANNQSLLAAFATSLLLRLAWVAAEVIHGTGHTLARALVDRNPRVICLENVLEHRSAGQMAQALLPLAAIGPAGGGHLPEAWLDAGDPEPWKLRLKASGGILLHGAVLAMALVAIPRLSSSSGPGIPLAAEGLLGLILSNLWLALASRSDLQAILSGQGTRLYCGNFGLIAAPQSWGEKDLLSDRAIQIFHRMGRETELRGAQAGGGLVMTLDRQGNNCFVGHKIVNAKRGDLTPSLEAGFRRRRRQARHGGCRPHPACLMACWHYRFGTSGPPAVRETHWQEWSPARRCYLWRLGEDGLWHGSWQTVHHRITHNGDFETYEGFGSPLDVASALGPWLERALHQPSPAVVDSARIAGMMDLLICQGDWYAAVRWAFLSTLAAFPHTPSAEALERWARHFAAVFLAQVKDGSAPVQAGPTERDWIQRLTEAVLPALRPDPLLVSQDDDSLRRWIAMAIDVFLHNDPSQAVVSFMEGARGSFGLVVVSTTWPDQLVLSSLGQPITIGFDPTSDLALYASESAAVDGVLQEEKGAWRIDLDANAGEIAVLSSGDLRIRSLSLERELYPQEVLRRRHPYAAPLRRRAAPSIPHPSASSDPVAADIAEIPALLAAIHDDWSNPGSSNRQSADVLAQLLIAKAANLAAKESVLRQAGLADILAKSNHLDLLITGVENSLWLGEQFAKDLSSLMPRLTVRALSANAVLQGLQHNMESLALARQSIVLVLSHSGRTFPSRQVMEACDLMVRQGVIREVFILTGEPESLLGSPMLAVTEPGEPFTRRLFTTGAGRRRAEPATASVAAMHQALTQLLFTLSRQVLQAFPDGRQRPLGMVLSRDDLTELYDRETKLFLRESREIVGADGLSQRRPTSTSRQLERGGRHWAQHVLEAPIAWAIHALYILISVALGLPLVQTVLGALAGGSLPEGDSAAAALLRSGALAGDVGLYIFGPWLWTLGLRWGQGRPLWARTGRRSLVVGEAPWIHPLLTNYISKLFSLSYGIASVDVQGADVGDHLLHTHAHRLVRGSLLFLGFPDGRCGNLQRAEADAALLTARQSDGIRHWNTGPEIVALGTESSLKEGPFRRAIILPCATHEGSAEGDSLSSSQLIEGLRESRFGGFRRLLASYVFFWAMARDVGLLPLLRFKWWRSQSRTRVMTTAAPVSAAGLDLAEPWEVAALSLDSLARREQS
jgi:hypothetical protein